MLRAIRIYFVSLIAIFVAGVVSAQADYRVQPGDTVVVEVLEDVSLNRSVVVLSDGRISFPFAGTLSVGGRSVGQIESALTAAIASNFANEPNVFVSVIPKERLVQPRVATAPAPPPTIDIYFLGEVNSPGSKSLSPGTTFLQAMAQSGGTTQFAADKRIQLRRTNPTTGVQSVFELNYRAILDGAVIHSNTPLQDGDVIVVPERRLFE